MKVEYKNQNDEVLFAESLKESRLVRTGETIQWMKMNLQVVEIIRNFDESKVEVIVSTKKESENVLIRKDLKFIFTKVSIGKSKELVDLAFFHTDFIRIEDGMLFIKNDNRRLKISQEEITNIVNQINQ